MKLKLSLIIWILLFFTTIYYTQAQEKKILFVGNSITYFNDMPILFRNIANNKAKNVVTQMYAIGGKGFVNHVADPAVYNLFKNNVWDTVVLQPGTGESSGTSSTVNTTIQRGQKLIDSIKKYSPCAKIILYQIPYGVPSSTTYPAYFNIQTKIRDSIIKMADNLHVAFAPAGESARMHYTAQQDLLLHSSYNDIHPNLNGSYLVAATMFATIFQEPVTGSTFYGGLTQATAEYFQGIADQVVLPNKPLWRINNFDLHADFNFIVNSNLISFTNTSSNATSLEWDFGDGDISTNNNPTHIYTTLGIKIVKLKVIRNNCEETIEKEIVIRTLNTNSFEKKAPSIYPNPTYSQLNISNTNEFNIKITNSIGQEVFTSKHLKKTWQIDVSNYSTGIYYINIQNQSVYKFIKL
ncbi:conserved hypothetical protein [Flavobacterium psychrophilum]|uniref:T9SS type A sorting domain-containing protein n=1 Tax=Flavobacterium psychrophilum TaxID=96345 RepID=UPI000B7C2C75|nr:T9SS type A sorting domain-containing protein [Flavobacterium psychrophilum]SNB19004.1 conserved hypothetical protein [Flavobacterium psychrophilum]